MKISRLDVFRVRVPGADPAFVWRKGLPGSQGDGERGILRITTDTGVQGVALAHRFGSAPALEDLVERVLRDEFIGQDPLRREWLWHRMWEIDRVEEIALPIFGVFDAALWDLAGRYYGAPTWEVMGGFRNSVPAYASTVTFGSIEEYLDVADQCLALGYRAIKLHAWGDRKKDAKLALALRDHVGPDLDLMYDGSAGFDLGDAIFLGEALHDAGFLWYEEPMREFSVTAYSELAKNCKVPLLVGETSDGAHMNSADFIAAGAATWGVRTGHHLRGGFTGALRTAHLADSYLRRAEVHGADIANVHLCMAISNNTYYESLVTSNPVRRPKEVDAAGLVHAPSTPGISLPPELDYPAELAEFVAG